MLLEEYAKIYYSKPDWTTFSLLKMATILYGLRRQLVEWLLNHGGDKNWRAGGVIQKTTPSNCSHVLCRMYDSMFRDRSESLCQKCNFNRLEICRKRNEQRQKHEMDLEDKSSFLTALEPRCTLQKCFPLSDIALTRWQQNILLKRSLNNHSKTVHTQKEKGPVYWGLLDELLSWNVGQ